MNKTRWIIQGVIVVLMGVFTMAVGATGVGLLIILLGVGHFVVAFLWGS